MANGLVLNDDARQATLIRRAYLDVIGIPPSPDEADDYAADRSPVKYERLIDRLLAINNCETFVHLMWDVSPTRKRGERGWPRQRGIGSDSFGSV